NRVLVTKPHNKTPYELLVSRSPNLEFIRPFGCPVTILNTLDHLGKFDGKANEGFLVRYSVNSQTFRVFNSRTRKVKENLHVNFLENKPNVAGSGPEWLFDIDSLTKSMNYEPVFIGNQCNGNAGIQTDIHAGSDVNAGDKPRDVNAGDIKGDVDDIQGNEIRIASSIHAVNAASPSINTASNIIDAGSLNINTADANHTHMPTLKATGIFDDAFDDRDLGAEANTNNLDYSIVVSLIPTTRVHKDHPKEQIIRDPNLNTQTRRMINFSEETAMALKDLSWIEAMQEELLQFKLQDVWTLVDVPYGKRAIGLKWVFRNKLDERVTRTEAIRLFLAYASFKDFIVYQMDVKSAFLYEKIEKEVYVCQPPGFKDPDFPDKVYKVKKALYGLHQAPRAWHTQTVTMHDLVWTRNLQLVDVNSFAVDLYPGSIKSRQWLQTPQLRLSRLLLQVVADKYSGYRINYLITEKPAESSGFEKIINFLKSKPIHYALTVNPTIYVSCVKQFWATTKVKKVNDQEQIQALVDKKKEDASKQRRMIEKIDQNAEIGLDDETQGRTNNDEIFGVDDLAGEEVVMDTTIGEHEEQIIEDVSTAKPVTTAGEVVTTTTVKNSAAPTANVTEDEISMAQALAALKNIKPKVVVQEQEMSTTILAAATTVTTVVPTLRAKGIVLHKQKKSQISTVSSSKDKGKSKVIEPEVPIKKKDRMRIDEEYARNLEAEE
nr:hypothetical protein [Tanacetum cinerariifolium]